LQTRGLKADYDQTEQKFVNDMQGYEHVTRKLLAEGGRTQAKTAVAGAEAAAERQPDELALAREQLDANVGEAHQRQRVTIWNTIKLGEKKDALRMYNKSKLVDPDNEAADFRIRPVDAVDPQGKKTQSHMLEFLGKDGKVLKSTSVQMLEDLSQRYGAQYKIVDGNLVRLGADGKVTPLYQPTEVAINPETGQPYVKKGEGVQIPAAGGIQPPGGPRGDRAPRAVESHDDRRVRDGKSVIDRHFGISEFTGLDPKNQPKYTKMIGLMGQKVRSGMDPEAAATAAINEITHAEAALAAGGRPGGGAGYSGPTPWRR